MCTDADALLVGMRQSEWTKTERIRVELFRFFFFFLSFFFLFLANI